MQQGNISGYFLYRDDHSNIIFLSEYSSLEIKIVRLLQELYQKRTYIFKKKFDTLLTNKGFIFWHADGT